MYWDKNPVYFNGFIIKQTAYCIANTVKKLYFKSFFFFLLIVEIFKKKLSQIMCCPNSRSLESKQ